MSQALLLFIETTVKDQRPLLCRVTEHFYERGDRVQILTDSTLGAQHLDQMLWTFSQESFIPHGVLSATASDPLQEPVVITVGEKRLEGFNVLIHDGATNLDFSAGYPVCIHFVLRDDPERLQDSRLLWQRARERGFRTHHIPYFPLSRPQNFFGRLDALIA